MKQIIGIRGRIQSKVILEVNIALKECKNAELIAVVERDRKLNFFIQYDADWLKKITR